jgi:hypothetical protein
LNPTPTTLSLEYKERRGARRVRLTITRFCLKGTEPDEKIDDSMATLGMLLKAEFIVF